MIEKWKNQMKKILIVSAAAAVAMFGAAGVAYAGNDPDNNGGHSSHHSSSHHHGGSGDRSTSDQGPGSTNCTTDDNFHQSNQGRQTIGGNLGAQDIAGNVAGLQSTRPAGICPSVGNNNHL